jgi:hypothetical protein
VRGRDGKFKTRRERLPEFVSDLPRGLYASTGLSKGAPGLVLWNAAERAIRFVEVKCPHWDRPSQEQLKFLAAAEERGVATSIAEWEFTDHAT